MAQFKEATLLNGDKIIVNIEEIRVMQRFPTNTTTIHFAAFVRTDGGRRESFKPRVRVIARVYSLSKFRLRLRRWVQQLKLQIRGPSAARQFGASGGTQHRIGSVCRYVRQFRLQVRGLSARRTGTGCRYVQRFKLPVQRG